MKPPIGTRRAASPLAPSVKGRPHPWDWTSFGRSRRAAENGSAGGRQVGERQWLRRYLHPLLQSLLRFGRKPPLQRCIATIPRRHGLGLNAGIFARGARKTDMEVVVVAPPRPDLSQPPAVAGYGLAQHTLDGRVDEDPVHLRVESGSLQQTCLPRCPDRWVDALSIAGNHRDGRHLFLIDGRKRGQRRRQKLDVVIQPHLVAAMAGRHRPSPRQRHIADQYAACHTVCIRGQSLDEGDQSGMPVVAVAGRAHHLPARTLERQGFGAGEAAATGTANCTRWRRSRGIQLPPVPELVRALDSPEEWPPR